VFGFLKLLVVAGPISACHADLEVFQARYPQQAVQANRWMVANHWMGTQCWDAGGENTITTPIDVRGAWVFHLERTLPTAQYETWNSNMRWRFECWCALDVLLNPQSYKYITESDRLGKLQKLKDLLGDEAYYSGWMPQPIPDYGDRIKWLQGLWEGNFQGRLNNLQGINPVALPDWIELPSNDVPD
jgi:hypothetical protein